ncbi:hypothetical protein F66182_3080 [Fusarium sp. NRRL 66182]|nr:hypothetical protein F66182_3080 [Fusarium sp. NRRL 66182]
MSMSDSTPEIILYDLACTKNMCFSPVVWKIRLMLNYKHIPYQTIFVEFPDIEPTLKSLGLAPHDPGSASHARYTVPAVKHVPSDTSIMDSPAIAEFLETTYPDPPLRLTSALGRQVERQARRSIGPAFGASVTPREILILSPPSQEYFRQKVQARLGHPPEDLLDPDKEERAWEAVADKMRDMGELMMMNNADGPFVLGAQPSYTDFFIAASLQSGRTIDEGIFQRCIKHPGFNEIYEACLPWMEKKD